MVGEVRGNYPNQTAAIKAVADKLGIGSAETLRNWIRREQPEVKAASEAEAENARLRRENAELRRANEILKAASAFFAAELDRPHRRS